MKIDYKKIAELNKEMAEVDLFSDSIKPAIDKLNHYLEMWIKSNYEFRFHTNIIHQDLLECLSIDNEVINGYTMKYLCYGHEVIGVFMYKWDFDNANHIVLKYTYTHM